MNNLFVWIFQVTKEIDNSLRGFWALSVMTESSYVILDVENWIGFLLVNTRLVMIMFKDVKMPLLLNAFEVMLCIEMLHDWARFINHQIMLWNFDDMHDF